MSSSFNVPASLEASGLSYPPRIRLISRLWSSMANLNAPGATLRFLTEPSCRISSLSGLRTPNGSEKPVHCAAGSFWVGSIANDGVHVVMKRATQSQAVLSDFNKTVSVSRSVDQSNPDKRGSAYDSDSVLYPFAQRLEFDTESSQDSRSY